MNGLTCDITAYQHPLMARVRELERRLADTLAAQLAAEREVSRLQQLAAGLEAENRSLQTQTRRAANRTRSSTSRDAHSCSPALHGGSR